MAIFMKKASRPAQQILREIGDKMYIGGSAHTKNTFKPIYGDYNQAYGSYSLNVLVSDFSASAVSKSNNNSGASSLAGYLNYGQGYNITNSDQYMGGHKLRTSLKSIDGFTYVVPPFCLGSESIALIKTTESGDIVDQATTPYFVREGGILFENETHIFLFGGAITKHTSSTRSTTPLVAVAKANMSVTPLTGVVNYPEPYQSYYPSTTNGYMVQLFLVDYDEQGKKATFAMYDMHEWGGLRTSNSNSVIASNTHCQLITLNAESGAGTVQRAALDVQDATTRNIGTSTNYTPKAAFDPSKIVIGDNGRGYFFVVNEQATNTGMSTATLHVASMNPNDPLEVATQTALFQITDKVSNQYAATNRNFCRVLERDDHFYVFVFHGMTPKDISLRNTKSGVIVYKAMKSTPTVLTEVSYTQFNANVTTLNCMPIKRDGTQFMAIYNGSYPEIFHWNEAAEAFVSKAILSVMIVSAMVDGLDRLWYYDINGDLHMQGPSIGNSVRIAFEDDNLEYNGTQLNSNLQVSCFNYNGDRVANNVTIQLEGGTAVFSSNQSNTITVMTSPAGDLNVPFTVNGNGYIRVIANMAL